MFILIYILDLTDHINFLIHDRVRDIMQRVPKDILNCAISNGSPPFWQTGV